MLLSNASICFLLAHLTQRVMWGIAITCRPFVVCPLTFSHFNLLLGQMEPNLAESIYIRSSIKFLYFVPFRQQIWPPRAILVSDWLMLKKSSPLKLLGQMEPNLAGSIYVRSSIKNFHLVPFGQQTWPLLLKIEHMVKLHVFGNNSKTVNNIRNLMG